MKKILVAVALALVAILAVGMAPVQASPAVGFAFTGTASLPSFPCTTFDCVGSFTGTVTGEGENGPAVGAAMSATFTYGEANCEQGSASGGGTIAGDPFTFVWTRIGPTAVITFTYAGHSGVAAAAFTTNEPLPSGCIPGNPAGPVTATVVGAGAGA